jgi:hypothetical protein
MAGKGFDYSKMAAYIIDSTIFGPKKANEMHSISHMTGQRWRARLQTDWQLQEAVADLKGRTMTPLEPTLNETIDLHQQRIHELIKSDDFDLARMACLRENWRVMSEIRVVNRVIDEKIEALRAMRPKVRELEQETVNAIAQEVR